MSESQGIQKIVRREVRSPRSAALAGILFSLLMALDIKSTARLNKNQQEDLGIIVGQRG